MNPKRATAAILLLISPLISRADWHTMRSADGHVVEIVVDFRMEKVRIDSKGDLSFVATASIGGQEIGFLGVISKPKNELEEIGRTGQKARIWRNGLEVRTAGASTAKLEQLLANQLNVRIRNGDEGYRFVGLYSAVSSYDVTGFGNVDVLLAASVGLTFDETGKTIGGKGFALQLVLDGPMGRLTVYFSIPPGAGGTSEAYILRREWLESKAEKAADSTGHNLP